jgi:potassium efflux system protein
MLPLCIIALALFLPFTASAVYGQKTRVEIPFQFSSVPDKERVREQIRETESNKELDEALKNRVLNVYRQSLTALELAAAYEARESMYSQTAKAAAGEEEKINRLLRRLDSRPEPTLGEDLSQVSMPELERRNTILQAEIASLREEQLGLEELLQEQRARPSQIKDELTSARKALSEIDSEMKTLRLSRENTLFIEARQVFLAASRHARTREIAMFSRELSSYGPRIQLLAAQRELATRNLAVAQVRAKPFEEAIKERLQSEVEKSRAAAALAESVMSEKPLAVRKMAEENVKLQRELARVVESTGIGTSLRDRYQTQVKAIDQEYRDARQKVQVAGLSKSLGHILLSQLRMLPDLSRVQRENKKLESTIGDVWLDQLRIEESQRPLSDPEAELRRIMSDEVDRGLTPGQRDDIQTELRSLLKEKKGLLGKLTDAYTSYVGILGDLEIAQKRLMETVRQYKVFLEGRVLWIPNAQPLGKVSFYDAAPFLRQLVSPSLWLEVLKTVTTGATRNPFQYLLVFVATVVLLWKRRRLRRLLGSLGEKVANPGEDRFIFTVEALFVTFLCAVPGPLILGFIGGRLQDAVDASDFVRAAGEAFSLTSWPFLGLALLCLICARGGVGEAHFRWREQALRLLRRELSWFLFFFPPALFFVSFSWFVGDLYRATPGRVIFMGLMFAVALIVHRVLKPKGGIPERYLADHPRGWLSRLRYIWYSLAVLTPLFFAGLAAAGYYYTATTLCGHLLLSFWLVIAAIVVHDLIERGLLVAGRRLEAQTPQSAPSASPSGDRSGSTLEVPSEHVVPEKRTPPSLAPSAYTISIEVRKLLHTCIGVGLIIGLLMIWTKVLPALSVLDQVSLWQHTVTIGGKEIQQPITLSNLALGLVITAITLTFARNLPGALEIALLRHLPISAGSRYAITSLGRYAIVLLGIIVIFQALGGKWSQIQWLVAALGVGLGFGLQEIFGNFVSGLIILFERPIRVGDTVTIGDVSGTVSRIHIRATTITDWDNKELIIPNKAFITGQLVNWTLTDPVTRITIRVGIAYGSDTALAQKVILETVKQNPLVMEKPQPGVFFTGFGESSLDFTVYVFASQVSDRLRLVHELHTAIEGSLKRHGISIPFPQRDIHIHPGEPGKSS